MDTGTTSPVIPPPPPGFALDAPQVPVGALSPPPSQQSPVPSNIPPPPPGFTLDVAPSGAPTKQPVADTSSIHATPGVSLGDVAQHVANIPTNAVGELSAGLNALTDRLSSYTQQGRAEHPILSRVGDLLNNARELLTGGQSAGKPLGTSSGILNNPVTAAMAAAPDVAALAAGGEEMIAGRIAARGAKAAETAAETAPQAIKDEQFVYREPTPEPQHGKPVKVASPLDNATINRMPGGKDLSAEAIKTLKTHIGGTPGEEIEIGSTPKNTVLKAVRPVNKTIAWTGKQVEAIVQAAEPFEESIMQEGKVDEVLDKVRDGLPAADEEKLNATIDKELQSADEALRSKEPTEILAYRRKLGDLINWNDIPKNPSTPGEVQNVTRAKIYRVITEKLHNEIPATARLDKVFQPNLELRSHLDAKLGETVSRDAEEAEAQQASELAKGKAQIENEGYNEVIAQNRKLAGLPETDVEPSIRAGGAKTPVEESLDSAVAKFKAPPEEQAALKKMLQPSVKAGKVYGTNTDWAGALNNFDSLTAEQRAARFSNPTATRQVLQSEAKKQLGRAVVKYGSIAAVAHVTGLDKAILKAILSE